MKKKVKYARIKDTRQIRKLVMKLIMSVETKKHKIIHKPN